MINWPSSVYEASWSKSGKINFTISRIQITTQFSNLYKTKMSRLMTKPTKWLCAQRRLRSAWTCAQSDQSSLCAQWVAKNQSFFMRTAKTDQTVRMSRLIRVFAGCTYHFFGFVMRWLKWSITVLQKCWMSKSNGLLHKGAQHGI